MRRKEERSKQGQTNNKAKQHSTPKAVTFHKKMSCLGYMSHVQYMYICTTCTCTLHDREHYLQTDDGVDTTAEGGGDGVSPEAQGGEEGGEGGEEGGTRPLVSHNHTRPHAREVHTTVLGGGGGGGGGGCWSAGCIVTKQ